MALALDGQGKKLSNHFTTLRVNRLDQVGIKTHYLILFEYFLVPVTENNEFKQVIKSSSHNMMMTQKFYLFVCCVFSVCGSHAEQYLRYVA